MLSWHNGVTFSRSVRTRLSVLSRKFARWSEASPWPEPSSTILRGTACSKTGHGGSYAAGAVGVKYWTSGRVASHTRPAMPYFSMASFWLFDSYWTPTGASGKMLSAGGKLGSIRWTGSSKCQQRMTRGKGLSGNIELIGVIASALRYLPPHSCWTLIQIITPPFAGRPCGFERRVWWCGGFEESATIGRFFNLQEELTIKSESLHITSLLHLSARHSTVAYYRWPAQRNSRQTSDVSLDPRSLPSVVSTRVSRWSIAELGVLEGRGNTKGTQLTS